MNRLRDFGFLLKAVSRLAAKNFAYHARDFDLDLAECKVLVYLGRNQGVSQARLAELTETAPMTLVRILDRMEGDDLIERRPDATDRRARRLYLKAPALPVLQEIWRVSDCARAESLAGLSAPERSQLLNLMQRVHTNLDRLVPEAADAGSAAPRTPHKRVAQMHGSKSR